MLYDILARRPVNGKMHIEFDSISFFDFRTKVEEIKHWLCDLKQQIIGLRMENELSGLAIVTAISSTNKTCILIPEKYDSSSQKPDYEMLILAKPGFKYDVEYGSTTEEQAESGGLILFTSGTSGKPKRHKWKWQELFNNRLLRGFDPDTNWLCGYSVDSYAGIQAFGFAMSSAENAIFVKSIDSISSLSKDYKVWHLMLATPTFFKRIIYTEINYSVRSVSISGEPVSQIFIERIKRVLKPSRIIHIYATTELGSIFSVSDGKAGFPLSWLGRKLKTGYSLFENQGVLLVQKPSSDELISTNDKVIFDADRVHIVGRADDVINVGGFKVFRTQIEEAILEIEGVQDALVLSIPNPITGNLVTVEIVACDKMNIHELERKIKIYIGQNFRKEAIPRAIRFVDSIAITRNGKKRISAD